MNAQPSTKTVSRIVVINFTRRVKPTTRSKRVREELRPFIQRDPDAEPGRGRLGHCY